MMSVIDFLKFKTTKKIEKLSEDGKTPLFVHHKEGKVHGNPHLNLPPPPPDDFADRMSRIRMSLERINTLMTELKKATVTDKQEP